MGRLEGLDEMKDQRSERSGFCHGQNVYEFVTQQIARKENTILKARLVLTTPATICLLLSQQFEQCCTLVINSGPRTSTSPWIILVLGCSEGIINFCYIHSVLISPNNCILKNYQILSLKPNKGSTLAAYQGTCLGHSSHYRKIKPRGWQASIRREKKHFWKVRRQNITTAKKKEATV